MEWSRRYKKAWFKYARKYEEHHNNIKLNNLCDYLSSCKMMQDLTNSIRNAYI